MRKEAKERKTLNIAHIQGYHSGDAGITTGHWGADYAFAGFKGNWYFNSDRREDLVSTDHGIMRKCGQPPMGYGTETEIECDGITEPVVLAEVFDKIILPTFKFGNDMFKLQHDGSLGGRTSVEVISQIMTKGRIRNDYAAYKAMYNKYFKSFIISADSYETRCGMHVNVSNAIFGKTVDQQWENVRKLYYMINKHYDFFVRALYRNPMRTTWCKKMTADHLKNVENWPIGRAIKWDYMNARNITTWEGAPADHHNCFNMSHFKDGRIEIRLVGGQKNFACFQNTMETVFHICERVSSLKWEDLDDLKKIFKGCNQYVEKRIRTECHDFIAEDDMNYITAHMEAKDLDIE